MADNPADRPTPDARPASFLRRFGAMFYDSLLMFGVLMFAAIPLAFIGESIREQFLVEWIIRIYLSGVCFAYFAGLWHYGGQTPGMRVWRLRLRARDGTRPAFRSLAWRFVASIISWLPLGAGYLLIVFNRRRAALHDKLSGTVVVHEPR